MLPSRCHVRVRTGSRLAATDFGFLPVPTGPVGPRRSRLAANTAANGRRCWSPLSETRVSRATPLEVCGSVKQASPQAPPPWVALADPGWVRPRADTRVSVSMPFFSTLVLLGRVAPCCVARPVVLLLGRVAHCCVARPIVEVPSSLLLFLATPPGV